METTIRLKPPTENAFAVIETMDGHTINYTDVADATNMLQLFFGFDELQVEEYYGV